MLFVTLCKEKAGTARERSVRRLEWHHPPGYKVIAEYWLQTPDPRVIVITECDDIAPIMRSTSEWDDVFEMTVVPAATAEVGMQLAREAMSQQLVMR
jgi:hypothetical protein